MISKLLFASALVAITVIIHAAGLGIVLSHVSRSKVRLERRFWRITWLLIRIAWLLIVIHLFELRMISQRQSHRALELFYCAILSADRRRTPA